MSKRVPIGSKYLEKPTTQGGTEVGVSLGNPAGAVAKEGGTDIISAACSGYRKKNFWEDPPACNTEAAYEGAVKARVTSGDRGLLGVSVMVAPHHYEDYVRAAIGAGVDIIISGADTPMNLPSVEGSDRVVLAPTVSNGRAAHLTLKSWGRRYHRCSDFIITEGSLAGGHLGSKKEELLSGKVKELSELVYEALQEIQAYEELHQTSIPVFAVGGVYTRRDTAALLNIGTSDVQMAIRFIVATECDADLAPKQKIVNVREEGTTLVASPVGLPGRAVMTAFMCSVLKGRIAPKHCIGCMKPRVPTSTPYHISDAFVHLVEDDVENGLVFTRANVWRVADIASMHGLMAELCT